MYTLAYGVIVAFAFVAELEGFPRQFHEGSKCYNTDSVGVCTLAHNCPAALKSVTSSGTRGLKRCGLVRAVEIVCCPKTDTPRPTIQLSTLLLREGGDQTKVRRSDVPGAKSKKICDNYTKNLDYHHFAAVVEFPHMAALGFWSNYDQEYKFTCGGTLISNDYVVTAAHCIVNVEQNELKIVRMGKVDVPETIRRPDPKLDFNVVNVTLHKEYNWKEKFNDIALVKLEKKVTFTDNIRPACLYTKDDDPENLVVTGWGRTSSFGEQSTILQKATLTTVPLEQCNNTYQTETKRIILNSQICAGGVTSDTCSGDGGGPLQIQTNSGISTIVGIVSFGFPCGSKYPGLYTPIHSYLRWIEAIVWPLV